MVSFNYRGLMPPVFTPFTNDHTVDVEKIPNYVLYLKSQNIKGILVNGTSGEGMSMSVDERKMVAEVWIKEAHAADMHVMLQVGGAPLPDVLKLTMHAESIKADSILALPELFTKPSSVAELITYLKIISAAAPNTPMLYYHNPGFTNVNLDMVSLVKEAKKDIKTFKGLKYTSSDLNEGNAVLAACKNDCTVFLGADQLLLAAIASGYNSSIGTTFNMLAPLGFSILNTLMSNEPLPNALKKARDYQNQLNLAIIAILRHGKWVPTMKTAMQLLTGIQLGPSRPPLLNLNKTQIQEMSNELASLGYRVMEKL